VRVFSHRDNRAATRTISPTFSRGTAIIIIRGEGERTRISVPCRTSTHWGNARMCLERCAHVLGRMRLHASRTHACAMSNANSLTDLQFISLLRDARAAQTTGNAERFSRSSLPLLLVLLLIVKLPRSFFSLLPFFFFSSYSLLSAQRRAAHAREICNEIC